MPKLKDYKLGAQSDRVIGVGESGSVRLRQVDCEEGTSFVATLEENGNPVSTWMLPFGWVPTPISCAQVSGAMLGSRYPMDQALVPACEVFKLVSNIAGDIAVDGAKATANARTFEAKYKEEQSKANRDRLLLGSQLTLLARGMLYKVADEAESAGSTLIAHAWADGLIAIIASLKEADPAADVPIAPIANLLKSEVSRWESKK